MAKISRTFGWWTGFGAIFWAGALGLAYVPQAQAYEVINFPTTQSVTAGTIVLRNEKDQFQFRIPSGQSGLLSFVLMASDPRKQSEFRLALGWTSGTFTPIEDMTELAPASKQLGFVTGPAVIYADVFMRKSFPQAEGYRLHFALTSAVGPPQPQLTPLDLRDFGIATSDPVDLGKLIDRAYRERIVPREMLSSSSSRDWKVRYHNLGTGFLLLSAIDTRAVLSLYSQDYVVDGRSQNTTKAIFIDTGISREMPIVLNFGRAPRLYESQQLEVRWVPVCAIDISPESESLGCPTADFSGDLPESRRFSLPLYTTKSVHFDIQDPSLGPVVIETMDSTLRTMIVLYSLDDGAALDSKQAGPNSSEPRVVSELLPGRYGVLLFNPSANQSGYSRLFLHQETSGAGVPPDPTAGYCLIPGSPLLNFAEGETEAAVTAALDHAGDVDAFVLKTPAGTARMELTAAGEALRAVLTDPANPGFRVVADDLTGQPLEWQQGPLEKIWCLSVTSPSREIGAYSLDLKAFASQP